MSANENEKVVAEQEAVEAPVQTPANNAVAEKKKLITKETLKKVGKIAIKALIVAGSFALGFISCAILGKSDAPVESDPAVNEGLQDPTLEA